MIRGTLMALLCAISLVGVLGLFGAFQLQQVQNAASSEPQTIALADLVYKGPGANAHVTVTDFDFGKPFFEKDAASTSFTWVPMTARTPGTRPKAHPPVFLRIQAMEDELPQLLKTASVTAVVGNEMPAGSPWDLGPPAELADPGATAKPANVMVLAEPEVRYGSWVWGPDLVFDPSTSRIALGVGSVLTIVGLGGLMWMGRVTAAPAPATVTEVGSSTLPKERAIVSRAVSSALPRAPAPLPAIGSSRLPKEPDFVPDSGSSTLPKQRPILADLGSSLLPKAAAFVPDAGASLLPREGPIVTRVAASTLLHERALSSHAFNTLEFARKGFKIFLMCGILIAFCGGLFIAGVSLIRKSPDAAYTIMAMSFALIVLNGFMINSHYQFRTDGVASIDVCESGLRWVKIGDPTPRCVPWSQIGNLVLYHTTPYPWRCALALTTQSGEVLRLAAFSLTEYHAFAKLVRAGYLEQGRRLGFAW